MTFGVRRMLALVVAVGAALSVAAVLVDPSPAAACSCEQVGTDADTVASADVAFIGRVVSTERLDPPRSTGELVWDLRYRVRVVDAVKGVDAGQVVVVYGSSSGTQCGSNTLRGDGEIPVALNEVDSGGWRRFHADTVGECGRPASVEGFRALAGQVPAGDLFASPEIEAVGAPDVVLVTADPASDRTLVVRWWWVLVLAGLGAVGVGTLLARRRR